MARHVRDLRLRLQPFGDVLEGRDPAAALHRLVDDADRATLALNDLGRGAALAGVDHEACKELVGIALPAVPQLLLVQHVAQRATGELHFGAAEHRRVAFVEQDDLAVGVEHAQTLRHVLERGVEHDLLAPEFALGAAIEQRCDERDGGDGDRGARR